MEHGSHGRIPCLIFDRLDSIARTELCYLRRAGHDLFLVKILQSVGASAESIKFVVSVYVGAVQFTQFTVSEFTNLILVIFSVFLSIFFFCKFLPIKFIIKQFWDRKV